MVDFVFTGSLGRADAIVVIGDLGTSGNREDYSDLRVVARGTQGEVVLHGIATMDDAVRELTSSIARDMKAAD